MSKNIKVKWGRPKKLIKCSKRSGCIMKFEKENALENITNGPGVYFFARRHGRTDDNVLSPLYIGESGNVRNRIKYHLDKVSLMSKIRDAATGDKVLVVGTIERNAKGVSKIVERALIKKAIADGNNLFNKQGTKTKADFIQLSGNLSARNTFGRALHEPRKK